MTHSFDVELAKEVGIEKALILKELQNLIEYKSNNQLDIRDGRAWVYYSSQALAKKFPYMKASSIRRWMDELEDDGYIESGFFSSDKRDRVKWYHIKSMSDCIDQNEQSSIDQNEQCNIYDTPHSKYTPHSKDINIPFGDFWNLYEKKRGNAAKLEAKWNRLKDDERQAIMDYIPKYKQAQPDKQYRKDPATFLNNRAWEDEIIGLKEGIHAPDKKKLYTDEHPEDNQW